MENSIKITGLTKRFGSKVALDSIDLDIPQGMSGGMQRRLGIAQVIIHDPRVIIVDEPTAGLDPEERVRFRNMLCEIARDRVVLLSTHIVGDIEISTSELESVKERYLVTGILTSGSLTTIKLISDEKPFESATNASADVEDAYMYIMHRQEAI